MEEIISEKDVFDERKEKLMDFFSFQKERTYYFILAIIVFISLYIRTRNIPRLIDITTGTWTLGPDLDPFLFLRWAKDIVANGSLMAFDSMRYVPLGYDTAGEMKLLAYMIAWFHDFLSLFSKDVTVTYSAIVFPVVMAGFTAIAFFLFARKIFYRESKKTRNIIALIATGFFILVPSLLPRTIAGIPEKESAAFCFMFLAFYFFLEAMTSEKMKKSLVFGILAGASTAMMALIWGGVLFIFFAIPTSVLLAFVLGKIHKKEIYIYAVWLFSSFLLMIPFSTRYNVMNLIRSTSTGLAIGVLFLIGFSFFIMKTNFVKKFKIPKEISSLAVSFVILFLIVCVVLSPTVVFDEVIQTKNSLISPISDRFGMTVAENKQPYFKGDWDGNFGPAVLNIPLYFWLFFIGSVALFGELITNLSKKEKQILTAGYVIFLTCLIFSRYSPDAVLDGTSGLSVLIYFAGWISFLGTFGYFYYKRYKDEKLEIFKEFDFSYILYFLVLTLGIIAARSGIRLIMVLGAVSPVAVSFLIVKVSQSYLKEKEETMKFFFAILAVLIIISSVFAMWTYYKSDKYTAENYAPGYYQWQWQKAMQWVRENTAENAVFAHWWDYGYWLQSIGERATILDGGNAIGYWNHLMGRYVLTGDNEEEAVEFLYAHNGTHLLIDSTEIGKYTAFSSIGSDEDYDRFSWIATFLMDESQTRETNNQTFYVYSGGVNNDEDIVWEDNGSEVFFPKRKAYVGAIVMTQSEGSFTQPKAIFVYNGKQYNIPLRYLYIYGELIDFGSGLDAGIFTYPKMTSTTSDQAQINSFGAAFYLSRRTVHSNLARLYLFGEESENFKLVHTEENLIVENIKNQGAQLDDFLYYNGFQGPIKIWEVDYPSDIKYDEKWISTEYPEDISVAREGEYR